MLLQVELMASASAEYSFRYQQPISLFLLLGPLPCLTPFLTHLTYNTASNSPASSSIVKASHRVSALATGVVTMEPNAT